MRVKCDYCGNYIEDTDKNCPHCGAPNERMQRSGASVPKTIEELKAFCEAHHLPLEQMRFFLGEDYRGARAFGIYKDGEGNFVVYKNKSDGSRAVRYRGTDEAYAVNELYQKMKSEISNQRARQSKGGGTQGKKKGSSKLLAIILAIYLGINIVPKLIRRFTPEPPPTGYYTYEDTCYYNQNDDWYYYDTSYNTWTPTTVPATLSDNYTEYFDSASYTDSEAPADFSQSGYYDPDYADDWDDDDWDWDSSDSWDSDSTDWDSDW